MNYSKVVVYLPVITLLLLLNSCATTVGTIKVEPQEIAKTRISLGYKIVQHDANDLFFDDFSSYDLGSVAPFGPWKLNGEAPHITRAVQPNQIIGNVLEVDKRAYIYVNKNYKDYVLEFNTRGGEPRVYFLLNNNGTEGYYVAKDRPNNTPVKLYKFAGNMETLIAQSVDLNTPGDRWFYWKIDVTNGRIKVYINSIKLIDVQNKDPNLTSGGIGLGASGYSKAYFDNIKISVPK